jgi:acetyl-CoA synthetase
MSDISVLLQEDRSFPPSDAFRDAAHVRDHGCTPPPPPTPRPSGPARPPRCDWMKPWDRCSSGRRRTPSGSPAEAQRVCVNCVDRHIHGPRRNKAALIWEGEPGDRRTWTYWDLYREVNLAANMLKQLGVQKGDRVAIYLPMIPEAVIAMLACARIGAIAFGGVRRLLARVAARSHQRLRRKVLITADGGYRRGQVVPLKRNADKAWPSARASSTCSW